MGDDRDMRVSKTFATGLVKATEHILQLETQLEEANKRAKRYREALDLIHYTHSTATEPLPPAGEWVLSVVRQALEERDGE